MRRWASGAVVVIAVLGALLPAGTPAGAAGTVTHSWMGMDAVPLVRSPALRALLTTHLDQVRAGAEFPDGGYVTRSLGTPGGDYGEEAHWQRFVDAYAAQIRADPACGDLTATDGRCAPVVAHLMGVAAHSIGDQVWDWLFEPNGPGFRESYLPEEFAFLGTGGLELQFDIVAIARHGRPAGPTVDLPDAAKIDAAFAAVGRADVLPTAFPIGETGLELQRSVEAMWAPRHVDALERAMPWTSAHMITAPGGVDFAARAIAGYYDAIWDRLLGASPTTRVTATAPFAGQTNVPFAGWTGAYAPGSNPGNSSGVTRIATVLSSALPYRPLAGTGSLPSELPTDALRVRDTVTGALVAPRAGYPRIVPYNPEAGEHMIAFQPAADLQPCRTYRVETTSALLDFRQQPVATARWTFRTSGCPSLARVRGTAVCDATGSLTFAPGLSSTLGGRPPTGRLELALSGCAGGQDGGIGAQVATGTATMQVQLTGPSCRILRDPDTPVRASGEIRWFDATGRAVGRTRIDDQAFDLRGDVVQARDATTMFPGHAIAFRVAPDTTSCGTVRTQTVLPVLAGALTVWPA